MNTMPVWFVSHGAPDIVMADNATTRAWTALAESLTSLPAMVLCISAHWDRPDPVLAGTASEIQYDFGGFDPALYEWQWPLVEVHDAAAWLSTQLAEIGVPATLASRALDHGVWVPLYCMWERPSFPVLQLSLSSARGARWHLDLGRRLAPLRARDVLIVASGGVAHNLRRLDWSGHSPPAPWADAFVEALEAAMARGDEQALCDP